MNESPSGAVTGLQETVPIESGTLLPLARYAAGRFLRTLWWVLGGTGLAWLAVWLKCRAESQDKSDFYAWMDRDLLQVWRVNHDDITQAAAALGHTLILVVCAVLVAGVTSIWLGWKSSRSPHGRHWDILDSFLGAFGGLPLFFMCFITFEIARYFGRSSDSLGWISSGAGVMILAWGEGNGSLWVRTFRRQFGRLRRAPHIIAAQARGLPVRRRLSRDLAGVLVESLGSRMVLLLGGAAIVEYMLELHSGIGYAIIKQFVDANATSYSALAAESLVLVVAAVVLRGFDVIASDWTRRAGAIQV
jgi:ABC-type dipeptide/oligopeptide/nickel transport system permease component